MITLRPMVLITTVRKTKQNEDDSSIKYQIQEEKNNSNINQYKFKRINSKPESKHWTKSERKQKTTKLGFISVCLFKWNTKIKIRRKHLIEHKPYT
jgi:acetate kinase